MLALLAFGPPVLARSADGASVPPQARGLWPFPDDGVTFDNLGEGARLSGVSRTAPGHYRVTVLPETSPINPSPWYAFGIAAERPVRITLDMRYGQTRHRYTPWLLPDGADAWATVAGDAVAVSEAGEAAITLALPAGRSRISAQPPVRLDAIARWQAALVARTHADVLPIGTSVQGRTLEMVAFGNPQAREAVLILGRQHPPETTGMRALQAFVDSVAADDPVARAFLARFRVLVVPVVNPDGVADGHWRTNANGIDLNRDWGLFEQPETRAVATALAQQLQDRSLAFALDFHSTWHDIFYTVTEDPSRAPGGVMHDWLAELDRRFPGRIIERPGPAASTSHVFKNWAFRTYGAPVVTYEVGDDTDAGTLAQLADFGAHAWMRRLGATAPAP
ncbi:M14 family metallopeptidase [Luteimonas sp. XNQY3]|nr:M14 family metallopeptidase [Luteimonas sp. XNQY3]MCD9004768.1 M14 family metallopeptidase [Luteimonas sp. XNQY3]